MARTKQTARMAYVGKGCVGGKGAKGKVGGGKGDRGGKVAKSSSPAADEDHPGVSTQQFSVKFDDQPKCEQQMVEGKLITCTNCPAILTAQNKIHTVEEYAAKRNDPTLTDAVRQKYFDGAIRVWICEFCLSHNKIPKNFNAPAVDNPCYLIRKGNAQKMDAEEDNANKLLIFCIDVSSSMETYVETKSRLEAVKEAIADELSRMKAEKENFNVGLIAFGSSVTLIGTKKGQEKLDSQIYEDFDKIVAASSKIKEFCKSVQTNFASLKKNVNELTIYGSTALGPALLAAVELASKGAVGSKVLLCTDGEANVGLGGSFNPQSVQFYNKMADYAKGKRVMVSILSIKGDNCNLKQLGKLSLATGGSVLKIDPKKLGTEFSKIVK